MRAPRTARYTAVIQMPEVTMAMAMAMAMMHASATDKPGGGPAKPALHF